MPRFTRNISSSTSHTQDNIDEVYTLLYFAHKALVTADDYVAASRIDEVLQDYRLKGAKLRYEYAPR